MQAGANSVQINALTNATLGMFPPCRLKLVLACSLSFCHGWANVVSLMRFGGFGSMMTGNLLFFSRSIVMAKWSDTYYYMALIGSYMLGFVLYRVVIVATHFHHPSSVAALLVFLLLLATDVMNNAMQESTELRFIFCFASAGLGCVNAVAMIVTGLTTHLMTLSLQKTVMLAIDLGLGVGIRANKVAAIMEPLALVCSHVAGTVVGAALTFRAHLVEWSFTPLAFSFAVVLFAHDIAYAKVKRTGRLHGKGGVAS